MMGLRPSSVLPRLARKYTGTFAIIKLPSGTSLLFFRLVVRRSKLTKSSSPAGRPSATYPAAPLCRCLMKAAPIADLNSASWSKGSEHLLDVLTCNQRNPAVARCFHELGVFIGRLARQALAPFAERARD